MEPSTFNLNQSVKNHIISIQNQGSITNSDAEELSAHLFDATDSLRRLGLSEEEAFLIASKRLGNEETLTEEYSKVNPSIKMNKVWAYLIIGFNLLYSLPSALLTGISILYLTVYKSYYPSFVSICVITLFHLLLTTLIWYIVKHKREISQFIEYQVRYNSLRIVSLSFIPFLLPIFLRLIPSFRIKNYLELQSALNYPMYKFNNDLIEFTYYLAILSIIAGVISLIFTINKSENVTLKSLFERPSAFFLVVFGVMIEIFAASTRSIHTGTIWVNALIFAFVYLSASFLITFYNSNGRSNRYILIASLFGIIIETFVGINADIERGNTFYTVYFVSFMLIGISLGKLLGLSSAKLIER